MTTELDSLEARKDLFSAFDKITNIEQAQRLGACLVVPLTLRNWFDQLAALAVAYLETLKEGEPNV